MELHCELNKMNIYVPVLSEYSYKIIRKSHVMAKSICQLKGVWRFAASDLSLHCLHPIYGTLSINGLMLVRYFLGEMNLLIRHMV